MYTLSLLLATFQIKQCRGRLCFQKGEDNEDMTTLDMTKNIAYMHICQVILMRTSTIVTPTAPAAIHTGPITRARARQLNYQVLSFLGNDSSVHENMMLPKLDTFVLLTKEGPGKDKRDEHWSKTKHGDDACARGSRTEFQVMISGL